MVATNVFSLSNLIFSLPLSTWRSPSNCTISRNAGSPTSRSWSCHSIDESCARFLENHPTIEELTWFPIGMPNLAPGSLPIWKRWRTSLQVVIALDQFSQDHVIQIEKLDDQVSPQRSTLSTPMPDPPVLHPLECLDVRSVDAQTLTSFKTFDQMSLRRLRLHMLGDLQFIHQLAEFFPNITWLSLPAVHLFKDASQPANVKLVRNPQNHHYLSMNLIKCNNRKNGFPFCLCSTTLRSSVVGDYGLPSVQRRKRCIQLSCNLANFAQSFEVLVMPYIFLPDSGGFRRNKIWQRHQPNLQFRGLQIPVELFHSGIGTGMFPGIYRNGMQLESGSRSVY